MSNQPPEWLQWAVRRLHNGVNRWTQRRIVGADGRFGWSAWSYYYSAVSPHAARMEKIIDWLFWPGHCRDDYIRIRDKEPLVVDWRTVRATCRVLGFALGVPLIALATAVWLL